MPQRQLFSALEIGQMGLPGLPKTKARVIDRARIEGWSYEEVKDIGGTKRLYEIPEKYLSGTSRQPAIATSVPALAGTIVRGQKVDTERLELAITALSNWEAKRNIQIDAGRRSAIIALLYDYLMTHEEDGDEAMDLVLRAIG